MERLLSSTDDRPSPGPHGVGSRTWIAPPTTSSVAFSTATGGRSPQEAGIDLTDEPAPLFQLLVLAQLLSARIGAGIAVAAAGS